MLPRRHEKPKGRIESGPSLDAPVLEPEYTEENAPHTLVVQIGKDDFHNKQTGKMLRDLASDHIVNHTGGSRTGSCSEGNIIKVGAVAADVQCQFTRSRILGTYILVELVPDRQVGRDA